MDTEIKLTEYEDCFDKLTQRLNELSFIRDCIRDSWIAAIKSSPGMMQHFDNIICKGITEFDEFSKLYVVSAASYERAFSRGQYPILREMLTVLLNEFFPEHSDEVILYEAGTISNHTHRLRFLHTTSGHLVNLNIPRTKNLNATNFQDALEGKFSISWSEDINDTHMLDTHCSYSTAAASFYINHIMLPWNYSEVKEAD